MVELPESTGFTTILTALDRSSKMDHFIPCTRLPSAEETAWLWINNIISLHDLPDHITSDWGPHFTACFWHVELHLVEVHVY